MVSTLSIVRFRVISTDIGYYKNRTVRGVFRLVHTTRKNKNILMLRLFLLNLI